MGEKQTLMVSTNARGGIRTVVDAYRNDGIFDRWNVTLIVTHVEGGVAVRVAAFAHGLLRLVNALMKGNVGLVHCHAAMRGSFWRKSIIASLARRFGVPVLLHLHGSEMKDFYGGLSWPAKRLVAFQLRQASAVLVLSESWRQFVLAISPRANVVVLPNYVTLPEVSRIGRSVRGIVQVLFLGLVGERKGIYDLLPAFRKAASENPELRLVVGGNGEIEKARAMAAELGLSDRVEFRGWVSGEDKEKLLSSSDVFVLPSHNEGLPVSMLEAMSWGLPVIASHVGGIRELVRHQVDGLVIAPKDIEALASCLARLSKAEGLRKGMGASGRLRVEQAYSQNMVLPRLEALYGVLRAART